MKMMKKLSKMKKEVMLSKKKKMKKPTWMMMKKSILSVSFSAGKKLKWPKRRKVETNLMM